MHLGISAFYHDSAAAIVDRQGNMLQPHKKNVSLEGFTMQRGQEKR